MTPSTLAWLAGAGVRRAFREGGAAGGEGWEKVSSHILLKHSLALDHTWIPCENGIRKWDGEDADALR